MRLGGISGPVDVANYLSGEVNIMALHFILFYVLMLLAGIVLTVITMHRMISGKISLPRWTKILMSLAMIAMLVIILLGMLPTRTITVTTDQTTQIITPGKN